MIVGSLLSILGFLAILGFVAFGFWDRDPTFRAMIAGDLRRYHATDIDIRIDLMSCDRYTFTYDVRYRDSAGDPHGNRCRVSYYAGRDDNAVYWSEPLDPSVRTQPSSFRFPVA